MIDPIVHVVLDANIILAWLLPTSARYPQIVEPAGLIIKSRVDHEWPSIRLHIPEVVATEVFVTIDKYHLCGWHNQFAEKIISRKDYSIAKKQFANLLTSRRIETLAHHADHITATTLVSPVNAQHKIRKKQGKTPAPMGASDCLIIGAAISLGMSVGSENVVLVTADTRLADVVRRLRKLNPQSAKKLGLEAAAKTLGTKWSSRLYPYTINLRNAKDKAMENAFQAWPLPVKKFVRLFDETAISPSQQVALMRIYQQRKSITGYGVDKLPYSKEIDKIRIEMVQETSLLISNSTIYQLLSKWRKAGLMKMQENTTTPANEQNSRHPRT